MKPVPGRFSTTTSPERIASIRPGHAEARGGIELHRVDPFGIDLAPDHVGALQAGDGAHKGAPPLADDEIVALDQQEAEIAGEIGVLEIGLAIGAGREDADARLGPLAAGLHAGAQIAEERGDALDVHLPIEVGKGLRDDEPVLQRVAGAGRRLRAVAEHPPAPVGARGRCRRRKA